VASLFGTDGVRGEAGTFLTADLATALGRAATAALDEERPQVLIIRDTRESGPMLEAALAAGVAAAGGDALLGGVLPTPAASILVRRLGLQLAAVVSASHNPFADNGIKFFSSSGVKLSDEMEERVEALVADAPAGRSEPMGTVRPLRGSLADYLRELEGFFRLDLSGRTVMLDCANGATHAAGPAIFERLGARVIPVANEPDGRNINDGCGSTHVEALAAQVPGSGADIAFAFDGDGDRVLAVDSQGKVHDGDELIALAASHLAAGDRLGGGVAVTVMSNFGFHQAMKDAEIEIATTKVGDRFVLEELLARGWRLGGEQSGHIIDTEYAPTGDGIAAALMTLAALGDRDLADAGVMQKLPQTLVNVRVADREAIADAKAVWEASEREDADLGDRGRVLIRPSGTEPLVRVMVEAPAQDEADAIAKRLAELVERELG